METISLKLPVRLPLADVDKAAESVGLNRNAFITAALEFYLGLDPALITMVERCAASLRLPPAVLAHAILVRRLAQIAAVAEVRGAAVAGFDELVFTASGLKTGEALFDELKARFLCQERARLFEELAKREDATGRRVRTWERLIAEAGLTPEEADAFRAAMVKNLCLGIAAEDRSETADAQDPGDGPGGEK